LFKLRIVSCVEKTEGAAAAVAAFNKAFVAWWYQWSQCPGGSNPTIQPTEFWPYHEWELPTYHSAGPPEHFHSKWGQAYMEPTQVHQEFSFLKSRLVQTRVKVWLCKSEKFPVLKPDTSMHYSAIVDWFRQSSTDNQMRIEFRFISNCLKWGIGFGKTQ
jgi:hypothetical protein